MPCFGVCLVMTIAPSRDISRVVENTFRDGINGPLPPRYVELPVWVEVRVVCVSIRETRLCMPGSFRCQYRMRITYEADKKQRSPSQASCATPLTSRPDMIHDAGPGATLNTSPGFEIPYARLFAAALVRGGERDDGSVMRFLLIPHPGLLFLEFKWFISPGRCRLFSLCGGVGWFVASWCDLGARPGARFGHRAWVGVDTSTCVYHGQYLMSVAELVELGPP